MAEAPVEYIKSITRQYAKLGYKPYGWVYNTDAPPWQPTPSPSQSPAPAPASAATPPAQPDPAEQCP